MESRALPRTWSLRTSLSGNRRWARTWERSERSSFRCDRFHDHAPATAFARSMSRPARATITSPMASSSAWGSTRIRLIVE